MLKQIPQNRNASNRRQPEPEILNFDWKNRRTNHIKSVFGQTTNMLFDDIPSLASNK
jgi:hypothetical protein